MTVPAHHARPGVWLTAAVLAIAAGACTSAEGRMDKPAASKSAPSPSSAADQPAPPTTATRGAASPPRPGGGAGTGHGQPGRTTPTTSSAPERPFTDTPASCTSATLRAAVNADHGEYPPGQDVRLTGTITNTGPTACNIGLADRITIVAATGDVLYDGEFPHPKTEQIEPGGTRPTRYTWPQRDCRSPGCQQPAPPGRYTATFRWQATDTTVTATTSFTIT